MKKIALLLILQSVFRFEINSQEPNLQSGLVAYYPFNGNTLDSTGNNHHSTSNGVSFITDRFGRPSSAAYFNGQLNSLSFNGYYIESPNSTIAFWVKPDAGTDTVFVNTTIKSIKIILRVVDGRYRLEIAMSSRKFILEDSPVIDPESSEYDFIAIQFDTQIIRFYDIIGFSVNSWHTSYYTNINYLFPRTIINTPVYYFKGKVDDVRIYSRSLISPEVTLLYSDRAIKIPICMIDSILTAGFDYTRVFSSIKNDGGAEITDYGVCWSTTPDPDTSDFIRHGYNDIFELVPNTTYYVRAFAINEGGIGYSNEVNLTTPFAEVDTMFDIDDNLYKTVKIGAQTWMAENLRTTRYADGEPIKFGHDSLFYVRGKYFFRKGAGSQSKYYYTWQAATNTNTLYNTYPKGVQGVCPNGWHIPTRNDFTILVDYLGGLEVAGNKLKARSDNQQNDFWSYYFHDEINQSYFSARGDGYKYNADGTNYNFEDELDAAYFWTSESRPPNGPDPPDPEDNWYYYYTSYLFFIPRIGIVWMNYGESFWGASVRCIKDTTSLPPENQSKKFTPADSVSYAVYPNPASDVLYLTNIPEEVIITIYDAQSRVRLKTNVTDGKVNIASLPKGIYFIHISDGVNTQKKKFVK